MLIVDMPNKPYWIGRQALSSHWIRLNFTNQALVTEVRDIYLLISAFLLLIIPL